MFYLLLSVIWKFVRREDEFTEEGVEKRYSTLLSVRHYMHRSSALELSESLKARNLGPKGELLPPPPPGSATACNFSL